jgi:peptidoglycan/LPS O-acetylase OafA/YrhL
MVPFWLVLGITLVADYLILGRSYPTETVLRAIVGVFTSADIYLDLNSPLWYFTPILFYYLLFPLLFVRRRPWVSALAFLALTSALVYLHPSWMDGVYELYSIHFIAFPLGMLAAWLRTDTRVSESALFHQLGGWYHSLPHTPAHLLTLVTYATLLLTIAYTALHSGVGASGTLEQATSMLTTGALLALFALKRIEFRLFTLFGTYSYELYLIHWPLLVRYDVLYTHLEGWIATILYLGLFLCLGWIVQKLSDRIFQALLRPAGTP